MHVRDRSATEICLNLPEIVHEIGSYFFDPQDLFAAACCSHIWQETLLPMRAKFPYVKLNHASSFLTFLQKNQRAVHHCQGLRILADGLDGNVSDLDSDDEMDGVEDVNGRNIEASKRPNKSKASKELDAVSRVMDHLADNGGLQFFMYALPGEPFYGLQDSVWTTLQRMSQTLQGLYIELVPRHWKTFLNNQYGNLTYLRLFLDTDEEIDINSSSEVFDPKAALITFLQSHPRLEVLHLYLGSQFANFSLDTVTLPRLRSFLLISKSEGVSIAHFIASHPSLTSLDTYTDADIVPFSAQDLPNIHALQVSGMTVHWFRDILSSMPRRSNPVRHLQITAARAENFEDVLRHVAPVGAQLRCLELIFWSRDVPLIQVLKDVNRTFPNLVELSLFIPSWGSSQWGGQEEQAFELCSILECFAGNTHMRAISFSDPKTDFLEKEQLTALANKPIPPHLQYIVWRSQAFRMRRPALSTEQDVAFYVERTYHPRNFRGSLFLRDWHEEMVFDHLAGDYEAQLR